MQTPNPTAGPGGGDPADTERRGAGDGDTGRGPGGLLDEAQAPAWLVRAAAIGARLLILAVLVWLLAELATMVTLLLVAVLVGLLLAGVFAPMVQSGERRRIPRGVTAGAAVVIMLALVAAAAAGIGQRVEDQLPELQDQLQSASQQVSQTLGVDIPGLGGEDGSQGQGAGGGAGEGQDSGGGAQGGSSSLSGSDMFGNLLSSVRVFFDVLIGFFLTLAFMFLFLKNGPAMWGWLLEKLGGRVREDTDAAGRAAWTTVGAYVRGLTVVAAFDAVGIGIGLLLLGVPLALILALLQFIASYIPTIGAVVAGAVAVAVAFASDGLTTALFVLVLVVVVQQLGNTVVEPYVMGRTLPINAFVVLAAVTAGGLLWDIAGALLFVPLAAAASAAGHELWERRGRPPLVSG